MVLEELGIWCRGGILVMNRRGYTQATHVFFDPLEAEDFGVELTLAIACSGSQARHLQACR